MHYNLFKYVKEKRIIPLCRSVILKFFYNKDSHWKARIFKPIKFSARHITWHYGVYIGKNSRIEGISSYVGVKYNPLIILHKGVSIQQNCHITCAEYIEIGENTALASNVTVTDIDHPYEDISLPIERQKLRVKPVKIGKDCKVYNNSVILPGSVIGNHCVVGANSVVKGDFPDFSIIVGCPARIVKRYDLKRKTWIRIHDICD